MVARGEGLEVARALSRLVPALVDGFVATVRVIPTVHLGGGASADLHAVCEEAGVELWTGQDLEGVRWTAARDWVLVVNAAHELAPGWARAVDPRAMQPQVLCVGWAEAALAHVWAGAGRVRRELPFMLHRNVLVAGPADPWAPRFTPRPSVVLVPG